MQRVQISTHVLTLSEFLNFQNDSWDTLLPCAQADDRIYPRHARGRGTVPGKHLARRELIPPAFGALSL